MGKLPCRSVVTLNSIVDRQHVSATYLEVVRTAVSYIKNWDKLGKESKRVVVRTVMDRHHYNKTTYGWVMRQPISYTKPTKGEVSKVLEELK